MSFSWFFSKSKTNKHRQSKTKYTGHSTSKTETPEEIIKRLTEEQKLHPLLPSDVVRLKKAEQIVNQIDSILEQQVANVGGSYQASTVSIGKNSGDPIVIILSWPASLRNEKNEFMSALEASIDQQEKNINFRPKQDEQQSIANIAESEDKKNIGVEVSITGNDRKKNLVAMLDYITTQVRNTFRPR